MEIGPSPPDDTIDDDLQRRLGRNLIVFQRIEANLKRLLSANQITLLVDLDKSLEANLEANLAAIDRRREKRQKETLGHLKNGYMEEILSNAEPTAPGISGTRQASVCFSWGINEIFPGPEHWQQRLDALHESRNQLVHHFLDRLRPCNPETIESARLWLDEQHEQACELLQKLRMDVQSGSQAIENFINLVGSGEFARLSELALLRCSPPIQRLTELSRQIQRADGWTIFSTAAQVARDRFPDDFVDLEKRYGHGKLKDLARAAELFEFLDEITSRGGRRLIYRLRPSLTENN